MKKIPLLFITTSPKKYRHIEYLAKRYNIKVYWVNKEYSEIQENDMDALLNKAMKEITGQLRKIFFIIEQTSVFLESYEERGQRGPGYYFKDWWSGKTENELEVIVSRNPNASIESGIALNIPNHPKFLIFKNLQKGRVTFNGKILEENRKYEWLKDKDFNFNFVPKGARKVYCEMGIDEFLRYDFRKPNLDKVCERINEYSAILNSGLNINEIKKIAAKYSKKDFTNKKIKQSTIDEIIR